MEGVKCVEVENEVDLTATNLGIICSYYYIKIETVGSFVERINPKLDVRSLLEILSEAEELKDFGYRPG
jgi:pre-mRNA-splicing helicase BRR2